MKQSLYALASVLIAASILLWPFVVSEYSGWYPHAILLFLVVVTMVDSVIEGVSSSRQALSHVAWVVAMTIVAYRAIGFPNALYLLGMLWFVHSLRSLPQLWYGRDGWWLWIAWSRDCTVAVMIFVLSDLFGLGM